MVVIEPEPGEEENHRVNVTPKSKLKPAAPTIAAGASSSHNAASAAGDASDGFETASESDFNVGDDDDDDEHHHQSLQQEEDHHQSMPPKDDSPVSNNAESTQKALAEANDAKLQGNRLFGDGQYEDALLQYEFALKVAPDMPSSAEIRSICHANRGICFLKLGKYEDTIKECTKALDLNPKYVKALLRRGEAREMLEHFEEAISDMKKILEIDQSDVQARRTIHRLEPLAAEKREKMKQEMIEKLKEMGNSVLGRFGMSIDNFKAVQDPKTGSYSVSFQR